MSPSPVYILGLGNLGKLLAHSLRKQHPTLPITLLFHRLSLQSEWSKVGERIEVIRDGVSHQQGGFKHENIEDGGKERQPIHQLIVATKTHSTVRALQAIRGRLGPWSTLLFLQNGIGTIDEVSTHVFPTLSTRPKYLAGIFNHGVYATSTFSSVHAGVADAVIGPIFASESPATPQVPLEKSDSMDMDMAQAITACPILSTTLVPAPQLLATQLQKLTINAVINPLTVIFDCRNGALFTEARVVALVERLITEISNVVRAVVSSSLQGQQQPIDDDAGVVAELDAERLRAVVFDVGRRTAGNISSMRQDRLAGRTTEIDYINGYVVAQGVKHSVPCPLNARIVQLVKDKRQVTADEIQHVFGI